MLLKMITVILLSLSIKTCSALHCPFNPMCTCKSGGLQQNGTLTDVSCIGVPFSKLPYFPHQNVSSLSVVGSGLEELAPDSLGDIKATTLSLMSNKIVSVHEHTFMAMYKSLEKLDMSYNCLQEIPIEALLTFRKLKMLNLESNEIAHVKVPWEHIKKSLISLYLSGNDLYSLPVNPEYSLSSFHSLVQIYIDRNFLSNIESNMLPFSLQVFSASDNLLAKIPVNLISDLHNLTRLYFKNNYITDIPTSSVPKEHIFLALDLSYNLLNSVNNIFNKSTQIKDLILNCNYIDTIAPLSFDGLSCGKLDISNNNLESVPERAFYGLENTLEHLDLGLNKLFKVPKAVLHLKHLKVLLLDYNNLSEGYPDNFLKNCSQSIRSLSLSGNLIKTFPRNIFKPIKKIAYVNFAYNNLENIHENDFFKWAENVNTLSLAGNSISRLNEGTFKHLKNLVELNLSYNKISKIDNKAFNLCEQIKTLDLSYGLKTNEFPDTSLKPLTSLIYLALSGNNITNLPRAGIYDLSNLQFVILDFNKIREIPENFFHSKVHRHLKDIRMSFNELFVIGTNSFNVLEDLRYVMLNDNKINSILEGAFKDLPNALTVIISNNYLDRLTAMSFINIPNLVQLDLSNNLLVEFSFNIFHNVTNELQPMNLNLSRNLIENVYVAESPVQIFLKFLDLSYNKLNQVPPNLIITVKDNLKILDLSYNQIRRIDNYEFQSVSGLEKLSLRGNGLISLKAASFHGLNNLQILDLSHNNLELLHESQFKNLHSLRVLDISYNLLRSLPNDAFHNTKLERLIVSNNIFVLLPLTPFRDVSYTLSFVDFSNNEIEQIGREVFSSMPLLNDLNLCHNKLTHLHSHDFKSVNSLIRLDLCGNKLQSISKDVFQHMPNLRYLNLAEISLLEVPVLQIANLVSLNLSNNYISQLPEMFLQGLPKLRYLDLSYNNLTAINGVKWSYSTYLKSIDISHNPLKILTKDSFLELSNLNHLNIQSLPDMQRFDSDTLSNCKQLKSLKIQSWPKIEKYRFRLARILTNLKQLKELSVEITEEGLTDQLQQAFSKKLQYLEITGKNLKRIGVNGLEDLEDMKEFHLKISGTSIKKFPKHMFWNIRNNKFTLDLSNNLIEDIDPEVLYMKGGYRRYGTQIYSGNINIQGNPLVCGCNTMWFGNWMKRYLTETLKINANKPDFNHVLIQNTKRTMCTTQDGKQQPVLTFEKNGCYDVLSSLAPEKLVNKLMIFKITLLGWLLSGY